MKTRDIMSKNVEIVSPYTPLNAVAQKMQQSARQVMTKQVLYCRDTDSLENIALDMMKNKVRRLPNKRLVGIVSLGDMAANSTDEYHRICGKALDHICAARTAITQGESLEIVHA